MRALRRPGAVVDGRPPRVSPLDMPVELVPVSTAMASERPGERVELLQGSLDLIVLRALSTMGPQHAYGLAARLEQVADDPFPLNQGTMYAALTRLEQRGWIKGTWQRTESNREAKYYAITRPGLRELGEQVERWRKLSGLVNKLLLGPSS
jgi:PadR family transcriptional regulator, regulatory protein PadR